MVVNHLSWLDQIQPQHRELTGDKAFYLGLLLQRGYSVIPGFTVNAAALREFLDTINWLEPLFADLPNSSLYLDVDNARQLQVIAQQIRRAIATAPIPDDWLLPIEAAVANLHGTALILRPSLSVHAKSDPARAGQVAGLLEAQVCWPHRQAIAQSLKQVWAELFRAKSLLYWKRHNIQLQQINLAVLVQPISAAIAAGDLSLTPHQLTVRATWGLGHALTRGEVQPDFYHIDRPLGEVQQRQVSHKPYAYRLLAPDDGRHPAVEPSAIVTQAEQPLHLYALESALQHQHVLADDQLQQLISLTHKLEADLGPAFTLEWLFCYPPGSDRPELYLTQASPQPLTPAAARPPEPPNGDGAAALPTGAGPQPVASQHGEATLQVFVGLAAASGRAIAPAWVMPDGPPTAADIPERAIWVTRSLSPSWAIWLKQAAGIVTEQGGMTGHGAIVARELGIPAVVGVGVAIQALQSGDALMIDGDQGTVSRVDPSALANQAEPVDDGSTIAPDLPLAPALEPPLATHLLLNLSQPDGLGQVAQLPVDGVGLLRSELLLLTISEQQHPARWLQEGRQQALSDRLTQQLIRFAQAFYPRPIWYRSLDMRSHEFQALAGDVALAETNPILGLHGTFSYQADPTFFDLELGALRQVQRAGYDNMCLLLPFVRTVEEFKFCQQRVERQGLAQSPSFQLWIMAEVPSVVWLLPEYVEAGVQGISIGSNDLTQLVLGVDRDHPQMVAAFDQCHPAVLRAMEQIIQTARQLGIPCSICGEAPQQHPDLVTNLVRWGITSISVHPGAVTMMQQAIAQAERQLVLDAARRCLAIARTPPPASTP